MKKEIIYKLELTNREIRTIMHSLLKLGKEAEESGEELSEEYDSLIDKVSLKMSIK